MNRIACAAAAVAALLSPLALGQDQATQEQMEQYFEMMQPGKMHKHLDHFVGTWNVETKSWWNGPDADPVVSQAKSTAKWVLDGRFLQESFEGEMMGMPFTGIGHSGYDTFKNVYVNSWMDSMGTTIFTSEGRASPDGKMFYYYGTMNEPMTGEHDKPVKFVVRVVSKDIHTFEMHDLALEPLGVDTLVMKMTYTRAAE